MQDNSRLFNSLIEKLISPNTEQSELIEIIKQIYSDGWRHSYSTASRAFLLTKNKATTNVLEIVGLLETVSDKIKALISEFDENHIFERYGDDLDGKRKCERCHRALEKLKDHIDLEAIRMNHLYKETIALDERIKNSQIVQEKLKNDIEEANKNFLHQRTESITILGIFASIIVTFVAGFSLSNSLLSNIKSLSFGTMGFWCVVLMGFIVNVLYSLYNMLYTLNGKPKIIWYKNWFNILLTALAVFFLIIACFNKEITLPF